jgi:hypothetical protein
MMFTVVHKDSGESAARVLGKLARADRLARNKAAKAAAKRIKALSIARRRARARPSGKASDDS